MKQQIEKAVQDKTNWTALENKFKKKYNGNFKRTMFDLIGKLNMWLKEIGLELSVKNIENDKE
jgi:hypothetical protein